MKSLGFFDGLRIGVNIVDQINTAAKDGNISLEEMIDIVKYIAKETEVIIQIDVGSLSHKLKELANETDDWFVEKL